MSVILGAAPEATCNDPDHAQAVALLAEIRAKVDELAALLR